MNILLLVSSIIVSLFLILMLCNHNKNFTMLEFLLILGCITSILNHSIKNYTLKCIDRICIVLVASYFIFILGNSRVKLFTLIASLLYLISKLFVQQKSIRYLIHFASHVFVFIIFFLLYRYN